MNETRRRVATYLLAHLPPDMAPRIIAGRVSSAIPSLHRLACLLELHPDAWGLIERELDDGNSLEDTLDVAIDLTRKVRGGRQRILPLPLRESWVDEDVDSYIARHLAHLL